MNSQPVLLPFSTRPARASSRPGYGRLLALLSLGLLAGTLLSGCARMKQYSIDSWQGPLPSEDHRYVQSPAI